MNDTPIEIGSDAISLASLVYHTGTVPHDMVLADVDRVFREKQVPYLALIRNGRVMGLCSREKLGILLGARYGFALNSKSPAHTAQVDVPLVFEVGSSVRPVLAQALARTGASFREDVVIVDAEHRLVGMISSERLANLQTQLVSEQVNYMSRQNEQLQRSMIAHDEARGLWLGLFESSLVGVALVKADGSFVSMNRRCSELLNLQEISPGLVNFSDIQPAQAGRAADALLRTQGGGGRRVEQTLRVPGKGERLFRLDLIWIPETEQHCICFDDITDQRALELRMKQKEKQQLFDTLVAGIAHELNNKITPVMGFSELLLESEVDVNNRAFLSCIKDSMTDSAAIIRQLLQLSKPDTCNFVRTDLRQLVDEVLLMLKFQLGKSGVRVERPNGREPVWAMADASQIKQVLINLVLNAIHAMEKSENPCLEIQIAETASAGVASVLVRDNGCGIPPAILNRIFDPFFTTKGPDQGTGLGLSVCLSIARQHKGILSVESEPGKGACFTISLPQDPKSQDLSTRVGLVESDEPRKLQGAAKQPSNSAARVLIIEDEEGVRRLMTEMLERRFNCSVDAASDGVRGLEMASTGYYDLVISDVRMPEMSGGELYSRLKRLHPEQARRFVFATGSAGPKQDDSVIGESEVPVLRKPFTVGSFAGVCGRFLQTRR